MATTRCRTWHSTLEMFFHTNSITEVKRENPEVEDVVIYWHRKVTDLPGSDTYEVLVKPKSLIKPSQT